MNTVWSTYATVRWLKRSVGSRVILWWEICLTYPCHRKVIEKVFSSDREALQKISVKIINHRKMTLWVWILSEFLRSLRLHSLIFRTILKKYFLPKQNCRPKFIALNGSLFIIKLMIFPLVAGKLHICHVLSIRHYVKPWKRLKKQQKKCKMKKTQRTESFWEMTTRNIISLNDLFGSWFYL